MQNRFPELSDIPECAGYTAVEPVDKGWSGERKFRIETADHRRLLARLSDISTLERKRMEFQAMQAAWALGVPMSEPISVGICSGGKCAYTLLSWIDGQDAESALPRLPPDQQYALGLRAGDILRRMHTIAPPEGAQDWARRYGRKIDIKLAQYESCGVRADGDRHMLRYIEQNRHLIEGREQTFHHGDYHVGNMIVAPDGALHIIDFNRFDHGDPWEEFNRIVWCADCSAVFASGRIDGYFGGPPPEAFFRLLALYIAVNTLSSIYWAIPFGDAEMSTMRAQAARILGYFDDMTRTRPRWYTP